MRSCSVPSACDRYVGSVLRLTGDDTTHHTLIVTEKQETECSDSTVRENPFNGQCREPFDARTLCLH